MKKYIAWIILSLLVLTYSCKKNEFEGERPDKKLGEALVSFEKALVSAEHGWKAHLYPDRGRGFGFYLKFNDKNRVTMYSDINNTTGTESKESSFRLKAVTTPALYFDTYSYMHLLADPDPSVLNGVPGWGMFADFEFNFKKVSADTIELVGSLSQSKLVLVKANAEEATAYSSGNLNNLRTVAEKYNQTARFPFLNTKSGVRVSTALNLITKEVSFVYLKDSKLETKSLGFAFSGINEIVLKDAFEFDDLHIEKFILGLEDNSVHAINAGQNLPIQSASEPILPLTKILGVQYMSIVVPMEQAVVGSGAEFNTRRNAFLTAGKARLAAGTTFPQMNLVFDINEQLLIVNQIIRQGLNSFSALYIFTYRMDGDHFVLNYEQPLYGNAEVLENAFEPIIEGLHQGKFEFEYELTASQVRASGDNKNLAGFKFIGDLN
ncbi:DUF4302 domain-containing protein [Sphingobacterium hotanense]|uniref:DUF4302 domain-containing protein n=1 Tax=Sphingobacterium hotanense TaxID=649196 RepID=UPI0021A62B4A|nr:DUF4302 domain-containing protein [Sphingobacterium hotanense]MCT1523951.1 DUF4302 domain-containing protein [Sphingobacterium hotanense]